MHTIYFNCNLIKNTYSSTMGLTNNHTNSQLDPKTVKQFYPHIIRKTPSYLENNIIKRITFKNSVKKEYLTVTFNEIVENNSILISFSNIMPSINFLM